MIDLTRSRITKKKKKLLILMDLLNEIRCQKLFDFFTLFALATASRIWLLKVQLPAWAFCLAREPPPCRTSPIAHGRKPALRFISTDPRQPICKKEIIRWSASGARARSSDARDSDALIDQLTPMIPPFLHDFSYYTLIISATSV